MIWHCLRVLPNVASNCVTWAYEIKEKKRQSTFSFILTSKRNNKQLSQDKNARNMRAYSAGIIIHFTLVQSNIKLPDLWLLKTWKIGLLFEMKSVEFSFRLFSLLHSFFHSFPSFSIVSVWKVITSCLTSIHSIKNVT